MKYMKPYIGITGFKTVDEIKDAKDAFEDAGLLDTGYTAMYGFLCSSKRLDNISIGGTKTPAIKDLQKLIDAVPQYALPMIHYHAAYHERMREDLGILLSNVKCQSIQLNIDWPRRKDLEYLKSEFEGIQIVMQLPQRTIAGLAEDQIARICSAYDGIADYMLIDKSGGKGTDMDIPESISMMNALDLERTMPAIAGGLSAENVYKNVQQLRAGYKSKFCIDAQGKLRTDDGLMLDKTKVDTYIKNAVKALR